MAETHVITAFLMDKGKVLLLRRSERVGTYRGAWAGISGFVERKPVEQAKLEIEEELGLARQEFVLEKAGKPLPVQDDTLERLWVVHPFLFRTTASQPIRLDWENKEYQWICPWTIDTFPSVPGLTEVLERVFPLSPDEIRAGKEALRKDTASGAMEMAAKALAILSDVAKKYFDAPDYWERLRFWARDLASVRPSIAPIGNALGTTLLSLKNLVESDAQGHPSRAAILRTISAEQKKLDQTKTQAVKQLMKVLKPFSCPITLSKSSTVLSAFRAMRRRRMRVVVAESRPLFEGRDTAKALAALEFSVTLIADAAMAQGIENADVALVGADALLQNGSAINKVGSHLLALAAKEQGIPFYVAGESYKLHPAAEISSFPLEEANPREIFAEKNPRIEVKNPYFEETPSHLITRIITEKGVFSPADISQMIEEAPLPMLVLQQPFLSAERRKSMEEYLVNQIQTRLDELKDVLTAINKVVEWSKDDRTVKMVRRQADAAEGLIEQIRQLIAGSNVSGNNEGDRGGERPPA